jgi:dihydrofolate reductase
LGVFKKFNPAKRRLKNTKRGLFLFFQNQIYRINRAETVFCRAFWGSILIIAHKKAFEMLVTAIVATAHDHVIGHDNQIPWYLPADLAFFKRTTLGHHVIMGRNCFRSIGRPLPKRTNIVLTRDPFFAAEGVLVARSVEEALGMAFDAGEVEAFIIGGGEVYSATADLWDRVYLTEVDLSVEGDVFFPALDPSEWAEVWHEAHAPDEKNEWAYTFRLLERTLAEDADDA